MPAIAIVGAGPGLGVSVATVSGRHGLSVALLVWTQEKLGELADTIAEHYREVYTKRDGAEHHYAAG